MWLILQSLLLIHITWNGVRIESTGNLEKSKPKMGFEPTTLCNLGGWAVSSICHSHLFLNNCWLVTGFITRCYWDLFLIFFFTISWEWEGLKLWKKFGKVMFDDLSQQFWMFNFGQFIIRGSGIMHGCKMGWFGSEPIIHIIQEKMHNGP